MRQNRIQEEWLVYRDAVIAKGASSIQLQECRRAFYGGVHAFLQRMMRDLSPSGSVDPIDERMLAEIAAELDDFNERVKQGLA